MNIVNLGKYHIVGLYEVLNIQYNMIQFLWDTNHVMNSFCSCIMFESHDTSVNCDSICDESRWVFEPGWVDPPYFKPLFYPPLFFFVLLEGLSLCFSRFSFLVSRLSSLILCTPLFSAFV